jgi:hypothetical protein
MGICAALAWFFASAPATARAQTGGAASTAARDTGRVAARAVDVASEDAIVAAQYDLISGPAGPRDWNRLRSLVTPGAKIVFSVTGADGAVTFREVPVETFIATNGPYLMSHAWWEREVARRSQRFGSIVQVFSTYEARGTAAGPAVERGIDAMQLVKHDGRWWIANLLVERESPTLRIPPEYLSGTTP